MWRRQWASAAAVGLLVGGVAVATGNHNQGTYVCGQGLEILSPIPGTDGGVSGPRGNCLSATGAVRDGGTLTLSDNPQTKVSLIKCVSSTAYSVCRAGFSSPNFCGKSAGDSVRIFVLKASLSDGGFTPSPTSLTVLCSGNHDVPVTISCTKALDEVYSVAGDCIEWGYDPTSRGWPVFNTCVRMARADYLGNGWSATRFGTHIQPYAGYPMDFPACFADCESCFEAYWNVDGAFCINHRRWKDILQSLVDVLHFSPAAAEQVLQDHFPVQIPAAAMKLPTRKQQTPGKPRKGPDPWATLEGEASAWKVAAERELAEAADSLLCIAGATPPKLFSLALLRNRSRINDCSSGVPQTQACGNAQSGVDPACQAQCP
jgi:hypothetical protein